MSKPVILITSREPFNSEGNSHMHYVDELQKSFEVIFLNPPQGWPYRPFFKKVNSQLTIIGYVNLFPIRLFKSFFGGLNDLFTTIKLRFYLRNKPFILWQFDPYYLSHIFPLKPLCKIYFPLDYYGRDPRDSKFAMRANLLVTVNSLFLKLSYKQYNQNILLLPHGFSPVQQVKREESGLINAIKEKYGEYFIFTGTLTQWLNYKLFEKIADEIYPKSLVILGKQYVEDEVIQDLKNKSNVHLLGHKSYKELKFYIKPALAGLILYDFQKEGSRNPIKITDYLSQNKVIINSLQVKDLKPLEGKAIYTASNSEEFLALVRKAKSKDLYFDDEYVASWKKENSYENLVKRIFKELDRISS